MAGFGPEWRHQRKAVLHGHCHQKALMGMDAEVALLKKTGIELEVPDSGCCGMAGSFGFERDKYDVSVKCGEHVLLPKVRDASPETLIIANGFSCQEQIAQLTDRQPFHLAQVLNMALQRDASGAKPTPYPERMFVEQREAAIRASVMKAGASMGALAVAGAAIGWLAGKRKAA